VRRLLDEQHLRLQRDRAQHGLRQTQAHLQALVDNPAYGIARCDSDGRLVEGNQALATMLGYLSSQELLAEPNAAAGLRPRLLASPTPGHIAPVELDWRRKDGTTLVVRCSGQKVHGEPHAQGEYELIAEDLTLQRALVAQLRRRAATDPLTGLTNYGQLVDVLELELQRSRRTGRELTVLLLDLDGLKRINDTCGHLAGNRALSRVARILLSSCRLIDTPARFGGDEFAVVAPETCAVAALQLAHRIRARCARDHEQPPLSISIGTASYPADGVSVEALLGAADRSLYRRKHQTRPRAVEAPHPLPVAQGRADGRSQPTMATSTPLLVRHAGEPGS